MTAYQKFKNLPIDHSAIGLEQSDTDVTYYCTIPEFGEMIFAVSPMNFGDCVHPIARNFEDLLGLLLFCGDMAALEQRYAWDEEQFKAFLIDCPMTDKQKAVLDVTREEFGLEPMEDAFAYVKQLQREFDLSKIPYTEEYYDPDMEYPNHPLAMSYSLEPDITGRGFMIQDCDHGDNPRQKKRDPSEFDPVAFAHAAAIGVIGGADGPTAVIMGTPTPKLHAVCSSLHFEPVGEVEWRAVFSEKLMEDIEVCLI